MVARHGVEFEYLDSEVNLSMANIVSPTEVIVVSSFHVEVDGGGGDFHMVMPYSMVEPIRELLDAGVQSDKMKPTCAGVRLCAKRSWMYQSISE